MHATAPWTRKMVQVSLRLLFFILFCSPHAPPPPGRILALKSTSSTYPKKHLSHRCGQRKPHAYSTPPRYLAYLGALLIGSTAYRRRFLLSLLAQTSHRKCLGENTTRPVVSQSVSQSTCTAAPHRISLQWFGAVRGRAPPETFYPRGPLCSGAVVVPCHACSTTVSHPYTV